VRYQVIFQCKARAPSGAVANLAPGAYDVTGDKPDSLAVRLRKGSREIEVSYTEFQRLQATGALKRLS